jgi:hypothetical protein
MMSLSFALQRCVAIFARHHHSLFGWTPEGKSHRLPQQPRAWPGWLGRSHGLEARTLIETPRWTLTTRDTQVQVGRVLGPCPGDHRFQEHVPCTQPAMARGDPHLIERRHVGSGCLNAAPRQPDRFATDFRHQWQLPSRVSARGQTARPLGVRAAFFCLEGAAKRVRRIGQGAQPQVSIDAPLVSSKGPDGRCIGHAGLARSRIHALSEAQLRVVRGPPRWQP